MESPATSIDIPVPTTSRDLRIGANPQLDTTAASQFINQAGIQPPFQTGVVVSGAAPPQSLQFAPKQKDRLTQLLLREDPKSAAKMWSTPHKVVVPKQFVVPFSGENKINFTESAGVLTVQKESQDVIGWGQWHAAAAEISSLIIQHNSQSLPTDWESQVVFLQAYNSHIQTVALFSQLHGSKIAQRYDEMFRHKQFVDGFAWDAPQERLLQLAQSEKNTSTKSSPFTHNKDFKKSGKRPKPGVCYGWNSKDGCQKGKSCPFKHHCALCEGNHTSLTCTQKKN